MTSKNNSQIVHRPGLLKQSNKPHKSGRSCDKKRGKGKCSVKAISHHKRHELNRKERKNKLSQLRKTKRDEILMQKRNFGGTRNPPVLTVILPLAPSFDTSKFLSDLQNCDDDISSSFSELGNLHLSYPRQRQRFTFIVPDKYDLHAVMDSLKVSDVLVLIHSENDPDEHTEVLLSVILAHSLPTTVHIIQGMDKMTSKAKTECRKRVLKVMEPKFPDAKLHQVDTNLEYQHFLHTVGGQKQVKVGFRDNRCNMIAEAVNYVESDSDIGKGTLKVSGYVRKKTLNVNGLVHIPGWGNFQMSQIDYVDQNNDPFPLVKRKLKTKTEQDDDMVLDGAVLFDKVNPNEQESLQSEVPIDPMEGEQTWPTEEELNAAKLKPKKVVKKVAEGTSEYQAAWIVDSDADDESDTNDESESDEAVEKAMSAECDEEDNYEMDSVTDFAESVADITDEKYDKNIDMEEEKKMLVRFKEERMNEMFPDEVDTPMDVSARVRFQRYRGLKNFSSSPWDPMENLPPDYARIYRFENFKQTKKKVMNLEKEGAKPGMYVTIHINDVPQALYDSFKEGGYPLVVYGLLPHEQKMTVVNVVIRKHFLCKSSIKSKDPLIFHIGYQRFQCRPIFSEHRTGNKFKYERFLPRDAAVVASFYAPVVFPPASVTVFKQHQDGSHELVATGSVLNVDPNRIVVKRAVLSGHPYRIYKRTCIVTYMFFNKEDINWFKPVELYTKCGRHGHIRDSIGSHGHMKCVFDRQLQSQDVVLMSLYKRVFPKWTYEPSVPTPTGIYFPDD